MTNYLQISATRSFASLLHSIETTGGTFSLAASNITLPAGTYYWRIKTVENGQPDSYTIENQFEVQAFSNSYKIAVTGNGKTIEQNVIDSTSATLIKHLQDDTAYSWTVTGSGVAPVASESFTTIDLIDAPLAATAIYNAGNNSVTITWTAVTGATGYKVLYKTVSTENYIGTGLTLDTDGLVPANSPVSVADTETSLTLYNLLPHTTYWFAVQASDVRGDSTPFEIAQNITPMTGGGTQVALSAPATVDLLVDQATHDMTITWTQEEE